MSHPPAAPALASHPQRLYRPPAAGELPPEGSLAAQAGVLERLRAANLRPTIARIGLYQAVAAIGAKGVTAHDAFQVVSQRGIRISFSSISRIMREMCDQGLFSMTLNRSGTAVFFLRSDAAACKEIRFECASTDRCTVVENADLHARLLAAARQSGLELDGQCVVVRG